MGIGCRNADFTQTPVSGIPGGGEYVLMEEPQTVALTALTWTPLLFFVGIHTLVTYAFGIQAQRVQCVVMDYLSKF